MRILAITQRSVCAALCSLTACPSCCATAFLSVHAEIPDRAKNVTCRVTEGGLLGGAQPTRITVRQQELSLLALVGSHCTSLHHPRRYLVQVPCACCSCYVLDGCPRKPRSFSPPSSHSRDPSSHSFLFEQLRQLRYNRGKDGQ